MFKSKFLRALLAPFFMFVGEENGGGGAVDRGDTLSAGAPEVIDPATIKNPMKDEEDDSKTDEDEEEDEEEEDKKEDEKKAKKDSRIPVARHKEILQKEREKREALEVQLAKMQEGKAAIQTSEEIAATEDKLVSMEKEYNKLLAEGEVEKAASKMTEIRRLERSVGEKRTEMATQVAYAQAVERARYDIVVERIEEAYPQMNADHDDYDKDLVQDVLDLKEVYQRRGQSPAKALQEAVKKLLGQETKKQEISTEVAPKVDKSEIEKTRKTEAVKRNIDAAKKTPPSMNKTGLNNDDGGVLTAEKVMKMSQDDFAKLDPKELARLRGDDV